MIDRFTKQQFEDALPQSKSGESLWRPCGLINGEYCYYIPVMPSRMIPNTNTPIMLYIRSSVASDGLAAMTGEDSIRCWIASDIKGTPLGSKLTRWIARTPGWRDRLTETLRILWRMASTAKACPKCKFVMHFCRVKKNNKNKGRFFYNCHECGHFGGWFEVPSGKPVHKEAA